MNSVNNTPATGKQTFYIFTLLKRDVRKYDLTVTEASTLIDCLLTKKDIPSAIAEKIELADFPIPEKTAKKVESKGFNCKEIYNEARQAGLNAGNETKGTPIEVVNRGKVIETIPDVCGFAGIKVKGVNSETRQFNKWFLANVSKDAKSSEGGIYIGVGDFGQSYNKKSSYAYAFAAVLEKHGIKCSVFSKED